MAVDMNMKVLIVDDYKTMLRILRNLLRQLNFNNIDEAGLYSYFTSSTPTPTLRLPTAPQETDLQKTQVRLATAELALTESNNSLQHDDRRNSSLAKLQAELTTRLEDPTKLIPGQQAALSFETDGVGANRIVQGEHGNAVELIGFDI